MQYLYHGWVVAQNHGDTVRHFYIAIVVSLIMQLDILAAFAVEIKDAIHLLALQAEVMSEVGSVILPSCSCCLHDREFPTNQDVFKHTV